MPACFVHPDFQLVELQLDELVARFVEAPVGEAMSRCRNEHPGHSVVVGTTSVGISICSRTGTQGATRAETRSLDGRRPPASKSFLTRDLQRIRGTGFHHSATA